MVFAALVLSQKQFRRTVRVAPLCARKARFLRAVNLGRMCLLVTYSTLAHFGCFAPERTGRDSSIF